MLSNPFKLKGNWYKANLHTHTTASDGQKTLEERVAEYRDHGYNVLAITDHWATNDMSGHSTDDFLVVSGIEVHPKSIDGAMDYHLVGLGVPADFRYRRTAGANALIKRVKAVGGEVIVAHPYWCGHGMTELGPLRGYAGVEVYNGTCDHSVHGVSSVQWDELLASGRIIGGSACDDAHREDDRFMGWTWLRLPRLTVAAVLKAVRTGAYYASTGPVITDFRVVRGKAIVECEPAAEIHIMGRAPRGRRFTPKRGSKLIRAECDVDRNWQYVRAEVVDRAGKTAWTNPIVP
jgi:hypothetical protein